MRRPNKASSAGSSASAGQYANQWASHRLTFCFVVLAITLTSVVWVSGASANSLPDGRGYELVSPPDKAGGSVGGLSIRTRAAADGSAVTFISVTPFGDAQGSAEATEYMAQRDGAPLTQGWSTHAITPRQDPLTFTAETNSLSTQYTFELSPDLSTGVVRAWSPLTDAPDVADVENLYLRRDLRDSGPGMYSLVTACPACAGSPLSWNLKKGQMPWMAGSSSDFHHILFESSLNLTGTGSGTTKLYASDDGAVRLVGLVPSGSATSCTGGSCVLPAGGGSIAGLGAAFPHYVPRVISPDGALVNFSAPVSSGVVITSGPGASQSKLYQSDSQGTATTSDDTTQQLNVSERVPVAPAKAAVYQTASTDGSRVFFTSAALLTNDAQGTVQHLYMWHKNDPNDEAQQLVVRASGGTFTLTFNGQTTSAIPAGAAPSAIKSALDALSTIGGAGGSVEVSGGPGDDAGTNPYVVTFGGALGRTDLPLMTADATLLTGTAPAATVAPWVAGGGHLTVIDHDSEPGTLATPDPPAKALGTIGASEDGSRVYFVAQGQLVAGEPLLQTSGRPGIYLWDEGRVSYIGSFASLGDAFLNMPVYQGSGLSWGLFRLPSRVTPNGGSVLFTASNGSGLTGYDHNTTGCGGLRNEPCTEQYVYSADSGTLACASCNPSGARATVDSTTETRDDEAGAASNSAHLNHPLSDDGSRVFFSSAEALVPEDTNGKADAYEYDVPTGTIQLLSSGKSTAGSYFLDAGASGDDVFFVTRENLSGWDVDTSYDMYDARVGGGFPDPVAAPPLCTGSACQGVFVGAPGAAIAGSTTYAGTGNATETTRSTISGLRKLSSSDRSTLAKGGKARLRLKVNGAGTVTVTGTAKLGKKNRRVVSSRAKPKKAGAVSIRFALSRSALSELNRKGSLTVRLTVRFKDARPKVVSFTLKSATSKKGGRS